MEKADEAAIIVQDLYKAFRLPHEQHSGLKQALINLLKRKHEKGFETQQVIKNVSFEIKKGEFFGIVGRNGSGKSTLLKLLAGIYAPDKGLIQVNGSLTPFIELGVGFNPELTGRENVYLNGALLGFSHDDMDNMYDDIVDFAELEKFMDQKLKNYSSGMQVRLAFSIAIRAQGDILLLDEVLAVGDEAFQRKCFSYFDQLKAEKKTVILVTHDMSSVERYCDKALYIEDGKLVLLGSPHEVATLYSKKNDEAVKVTHQQYPHNDHNVTVAIKDKNGQVTDKFTAGDTMYVNLSWVYKNVENIGVAIFKKSGEYIYGTNTYVEKRNLHGQQHCIYHVSLNLVEGEYFLKVGFFGKTDNVHIDFMDNAGEFMINRDKKDARWQGYVKLKSEWVVES